ncbi:MAG: hypothetical protein H8E44_19540 [Planctomycetes bacterium]|nr:hypothetical protein [Planctomycetota bacterium]MBL7037034.1 hypothetical protein [Pirellulaceae bacterium]
MRRVLIAMILIQSEFLFAAESLRNGFQLPANEYRPETWFHLCSRNITKIGITKDLEAIRRAGLRGIHLFSKGNDRPDRIWPNVRQVKTLSPEWYEAVTHAAGECKRLALSFTLHNCPGWSQAGGPWVPVEESQRRLVHTIRQVTGGSPFSSTLPVQNDEELNYQDICVLAFPTPKDDTVKYLVPSKIETNNPEVSWGPIIDTKRRLNPRPRSGAKEGVVYDNNIVNKVNGSDTWLQVWFDEPVTLRALELPPGNKLYVNKNNPVVDVNLLIEQVDHKGTISSVAERQIPSTSWQDGRVSLTFALPETTTQGLRITFRGSHPITLRYLYFNGCARVDNWETKAALACRSLEQQDVPEQDPACFIESESIIDLSDKLDPATGRLNWNVPAGKWTVVRFGHRNTRHKNGPATSESTGWECSKFDKQAIENHLRNGMVGKLTADDGSIGKGQLNGLLLDSWERGTPTWTMKSDGMFEEFKTRRGYDLRPFLPALMGYVIDDHRYTERFLRDMRQTIDDLFVDNYFGHFNKVAHGYGAVTYVEGAAGEVIPGDPLRYFGVSDIPMPEFWYPHPPSNPHQGRNDKPIGAAASAAHIYNKQRVAAEACTMLGTRWTEHPYAVKYLVDYNFTLGVNHLVFHSFTHNPYEDVVPGSTFGSHIGFPWVRGQTWWKHMPAFTEYLARCQYLLQQGEFSADVLWYLGDDIARPEPQDRWFFGENFLYPSPDAEVETKGYRFDHLNSEVLNSPRMFVKDGRICIKDGGEYRVIKLRGSERMTLETARTLEELTTAGAVIYGNKPQYSPTLMDGPEDEAEVKRISDTLWGKGKSGVKQTGKGRVYWGKSFKEVMAAEQIEPDVTFPKGANISWIHRKVGDADVYFLYNGSDNELGVSVSFRIQDKAPEIWDPMTGKQGLANVWREAGNRTDVALRFDPNGSTVVVFSPGREQPAFTKLTHNGKTLLDSDPAWLSIPQEAKAMTGTSGTGEDGERKRVSHGQIQRAIAQLDHSTFTAWEAGSFILEDSAGTTRRIQTKKPTSIALNGSWKVSFESGWDTPASLDLKELKPLSAHTAEAVKYYSGTATYEKEFDLTAAQKAIRLSLGEVAVIAEVWCNSKKVGTRWAPPFAFDLSEFVKPGKNRLTVKVTNTWRNQLIYDNTRPRDKRKTWATSSPGSSTEAPSPSGLIGPVEIYVGDAIHL